MSRYLNHLFTAVTTLAIVVAGVAVWRSVMAHGLASPPRLPIETVTELRIPADKVANVRGSGRLALVEFSDFECPYCARHATTTGVQLEKALVQAGQMRQAFFHFPLARHIRGRKASAAVECAARSGRFWDMYGFLFESSPALADGDLWKGAERTGIRAEDLKTCLAGGEAAARVERDLELGRSLGVRSTPTFFVGVVEENGDITLMRRITGALPYEQFAGVIEEVKGTRSATATVP